MMHWLARVSLPLCFLAAPLAAKADITPLELANATLSFTFEMGQPVGLLDKTTGETLVTWNPDDPLIAVRTTDRVTYSLGPAHLLEDRTLPDGARWRRLNYEITTPIHVTAQIVLTLAAVDPDLTIEATVVNQSAKEIELVAAPANMLVARGAGKFLAYPHQSGVLIPLDDRLDRIKLYNTLPLVFGYPSSAASMQWMGLQTNAGSLLIQSTDRYGALKRFGVVPAGSASARLVIENQASLRPGETFAVPAWRLRAIPGGDSLAMARVYRDWVRELTAADYFHLRRDTISGVEKIPLQFVPLAAKAQGRPWLDRLRDPAGYPEHGMRGTVESPAGYVPDGAAFEMLKGFEAVYGVKTIPQMWTFGRRAAMSGWPFYPLDPPMEQPRTIYGVAYPGLTLGDFLKGLRALDNPLFLYFNHALITTETPEQNFDKYYNKTGHDATPYLVNGDSYPVSPLPMRPIQMPVISQLAAWGGDAEACATAIMLDSSDYLGGTNWGNSQIRNDVISDIDRNTQAQYIDRYGYEGRDSFVQDLIQRDVAMNEATPAAVKIGEWINEWETLFLDMNAGSIDLKREYPDTSPRAPGDNMIPAPLYQAVYGDTQYVVIRVGAASDANLGDLADEASITPAPMSRRASATFGAPGQTLFWGAVQWAGDTYHKRLGMTYLVCRDTLARREAFGRAVDYRMLAANGQPTVNIFALRETRFLDGDGRALGVNWDNNTGLRVGDVTIDCDGVGRVRLMNMFGSPEEIFGSLGRMRQGASASLMRGGRFAVWDFAGRIDVDGRTRLRIEDSGLFPTGLAVIWDGRRLTLGNAAVAARHVRLVWDAPTTGTLAPVPSAELTAPDGQTATVNYLDTGDFTITPNGTTQTIEVNLPGAPNPVSDRETPASIVSLDFTPSPDAARGFELYE
ncbi:MAG: hypothetical protein M1457_07620 [bacterium]|nr:hypothetical protein [bacterium]